MTEGLFTLFTDFSMTPNPLSKNARYAQAYGFRGLVVPPGLVMAIVFSQSVEDISENARANLEYIDMRFGAPVYVGDTLEAETLILGVKGSSKDPSLGVVHVQTTGRNQDGAVVLTFQRKVQVWKKDPKAPLSDAEEAPRDVPVALLLPPYDPSRDYRALAHLSSPDTYLEDYRAGDVFEHTRGARRHNRPHHADGRARQHFAGPLQPVDGRAAAGAVRRRPADRLRRHPLPDLPRPRLGRRRPTTPSGTCAT